MNANAENAGQTADQARPPAPLRLFEGVGIEIEYVIVDSDSLDVRPFADLALKRVAQSEVFVTDVDDGDIALSNELAGHVLELKTNGPAAGFEGLAACFRVSVDRLAAELLERNAELCPGGMHPWMVPKRETRLWTHDGAEVYRAYDRIFDCRRHGWANVQSVHLNLPFGDAHEFARLAAAVRCVLPALPALAASSPFVEGLTTGKLDTRLEYYRHHADRVPSMVGGVIPEPFPLGLAERATIADARAAYRAQVLDPIDRELAPLDTDGILVGHEWVNARGAIARFDRQAIEIRLLDTQECPRADLALCALVTAVVRGLCEERWSAHAAQHAADGTELDRLLDRAAHQGPDAELPPAYAALFGVSRAATLAQLWTALADELFDTLAEELREPLDLVLAEGPLATRLLHAAGPKPDRERLTAVYRELVGCLEHDRLFEAL